MQSRLPRHAPLCCSDSSLGTSATSLVKEVSVTFGKAHLEAANTSNQVVFGQTCQLGCCLDDMVKEHMRKLLFLVRFSVVLLFVEAAAAGESWRRPLIGGDRDPLCGRSPAETCDFVFEGFADTTPFINLNTTGGSGVGPFVIDRTSGTRVWVRQSGTGDVHEMCGRSEGLPVANHEFWVEGQPAQVHVSDFQLINPSTSGLGTHQHLKRELGDLCISLPLLNLHVGTLHLTPGDENQEMYPESRRCVVFQTGTSGSPCRNRRRFLAGNSTNRPKRTTPVFPAMFTFGDSTVDVGANNLLKDVNAFKANFPPYGKEYILASGRFSDGKILVDYWADFAGIPTAPPFTSLTSDFTYGINYGSAGAGVFNSTNCNGDSRCFSLESQLSSFANVVGKYSREVIADSLFSISVGSNDYFTNGEAIIKEPTSLLGFVQEVVEGIVRAIQFLQQKGARKFAVAEIPSLGCVPGVLAYLNTSLTNPSCDPVLNAISTTHNTALRTALVTNSALSDANITIIGLESFTSDVSNHPETFGFLIGYTACCGGGPFNGKVQCGRPRATQCPDQSVYAYWDAAHVTQKACALFANLTFYSDSNVYSWPHALEAFAEAV